MPPKKKIKVAGNQQKIKKFTGQQSQSDKLNESAEDKLPEESNFQERPIISKNQGDPCT